MSDAPKPLVVLGFLGSKLDSGSGPKRWERWRPSVALCQFPDLLIARFELLYPKALLSLAQVLKKDIAQVSPETQVNLVEMEIKNAWDLGEVYSSLLDYCRGYKFQPDREDYLAHITTGTHIAQICLFLLTESRFLPGKLIQTSPPKDWGTGPGQFDIIDLDLSRYDRIAHRFQQETQEAVSFLKSGIETRNSQFNALIAQIEAVAIRSREPILLQGPTGAGKSRLAEKIFELKKARNQVAGGLKAVNCATLRGDSAMSTLFGHSKGAFTGATSDRAGLLKAADGGILFLDEIGELGADEQAMLLRAIEEKTFLPMGSDREVRSDFQLIAGTNRDLRADVARQRFREDLLARIDLWNFVLPGLKERREDIEPNLNYEIEQCSRRMGSHITLNKEAREAFLLFALSPEARWPSNFRDLNAAVVRMATLATGGRISVREVQDEVQRLRRAWQAGTPVSDLLPLLGAERLQAMDLFDRLQLEAVVGVCRQCPSLSEAGRRLFGVSLGQKQSRNDADRLRKFLTRFGLHWEAVHA